MKYGDILKKSIGWSLVFAGLVNLMIAWIEYITRYRIITLSSHIDILKTTILFSLIPSIIGGILLIEPKSKELFL